MVALRQRKSHHELLSIVGVILVSAGLLLGLQLGSVEAKWVVYLLAALSAGVLLLASRRIKTTLLVLFILALQVHVSLYLNDPRRLWVGLSGPDGLALRLITIPASILCLLSGITLPGAGRPVLSWGKEMTYPAAAFFVTTALTLLYTPERALTIYILVEFVQYYLIFLTALNAVQSRADVDLVVRLLLLTLAMQAVVCFIQNGVGYTFNLLGETTARSDGDLQRHGGTVSANVKGFANFIVPLLLLAVSRFLFMPAGRAQRWAALVCVLGTAALILTFTRASWAGFVLGFAWLVTVGLKQRRLQPSRLVTIGVLALLAVAVLLPQILLRLADDHAADYEERAVLMRIAWNIIRTNPLLGVGAGAYGHVLHDYVSFADRSKWLYIVHNAYLLRWAETGLLGLLSLLALLGAGFRQAMVCSRGLSSDRSMVALGWSAGLIALAWEMLWDFALGPQTYCLLWLLFGLTLAMRRLDRQAPPAVEAWQTSPQSPWIT